MPRFTFRVRDIAITVVILCLCFGASILMQNVFSIPEQVTTTFAFGVFLISLLTDGYLYGLIAAMSSLLLVNYAFTFPYFAINFLIPANFYSAVVMAIIAVLTSALTTKLKRAEAAKAENEKERMRANLLRAISHDLRTPLTAIYGSSTILRENRSTLSADQQDRMLKGIQEDCQWLVQMIENILSITRIDTGNVTITKTPTALDELIDSVLRKFRNRYPDYKVTLELPQELVIIPMDALLIQQVLINMLENAVQHGKTVTRVLLRVTASEGQAIFEIMDDGCGIPLERLPDIFDGYFDIGEDAADTVSRNAGIGLSVCATIIRAHGGTIHAENALSGGAVFRFTLNTEDTVDE